MDSELPPQDSMANPGRIASVRSDRSRSFESFWRSLPKDGLVPHRRDMKPTRAASLLRDIVMLEARLGENPSLRIRLTGSSVQERIQSNITGLDYLDLRPSEYRAGTLGRVRDMIGKPCGLWQVMALHYERGFAQNFELTAFPLLSDEDQMPLVLALMNPMGGLVRARPLGGKPVMADAATALDYIDIGAGTPIRLQ